MVKIFENIDFGQNFREMANLGKIFENLDFGEDFRNISILVKIVESIDLENFPQKSDSGQNSRKFQVWS